MTNFNKRHRVQELPELNPGQNVWITDLKTYGTIKSKHVSPRSYNVNSNNKMYRRNRKFLIPCKTIRQNNVNVKNPLYTQMLINNKDCKLNSDTQLNICNEINESHNNKTITNSLNDTNSPSIFSTPISSFISSNKKERELNRRQRRPPVWLNDFDTHY